MKPITRSRICTALVGRFLPVLIVSACWVADVRANTLLYWNGSAPSGPASGTWNMNPNNLTWSPNDDENANNDSNPQAYVPGSSTPIPIFANGNGTDGFPSPYTVMVDDSFGQVTITDMHCDVGPLTLTGDPIVWFSQVYQGPGYNLISAFTSQMFTINCALSNAWNSSDGTAFHKYKPGTLVLGATNTWTGNENLMIEGGTVMITVDQSLPNGSGLILANGDARTSPGDGWIDTPATFNTGGRSQTLGTLTLTGPNSADTRTIDFNNGQGTLSFANSSGVAWTTVDAANNGDNPGPIPLMINNYALGGSRLRFGTDNTGLTTAQLGQIQFENYLNLPGVIDNNGYVTPALPIFQSLTVSGSSVQIAWTNTVAGYTYELDFSTNLSAPSSWQMQGDYVASGNTLTATDTFHPPARYYRVQVLAQ